MIKFQLSVTTAAFIAFIFSALLNKSFMHLTKQFKKKNYKSEKRLSDKNISHFGGIATSIAFLVSTFFLGRADQDFVIIGLCAVIISIIGLLDLHH